MCGQLTTDPSPYVYVFDQHCGGGAGGGGASGGRDGGGRYGGGGAGGGGDGGGDAGGGAGDSSLHSNGPV